MRRYDQDGHLHVEMSNISKANVCPYYGREIPDSESMGLDPNRLYMLYRDPEELARAAASFAGKPLLMHHIPVTADEPATDLVVGTIGTDVQFEHPYLRAPLSVWRGDAIRAIERHQKEELSPGYRYTADMKPGITPEGVAFHGRMRNIMGNHVAIVPAGRTGPDVVVADEQPAGTPMRFARFFAALAAAFPALPAAQALALDTALAEDLKPKVVEDEFPHLSADERKAALDAFMKTCGKAMDALSDEDRREAYKRVAKDKNPVPAGLDEAAVKVACDAAVAKAVEGMVAKADADKLAADAATAARADVHALYAAREAVASKVGVVALDSAEAVYRFALDKVGVAHKDVAAPALASLYDASIKSAPAPVIAQDAAPPLNIIDLFPGLSLIRRG